MEGPEDLTPRREQLLLKEYELCQDSAYKLESTIWQTSAAIGIGSIGSLVLLVRAQPPWLGALAIGILVNYAAWIWWHMARRWWSIQHAKFRRMRHIEQILHFHQVSYLDYLDAATVEDTKDAKNDTCQGLDKLAYYLRRQHLIETYLPNDGTANDLEDLRENHQHKGVQEYLKCFPLWNAVAWEIYVICLLLQR